MKNFWQDLPQPFTALAPMDDVTDTVFRQMVASVARPDVFFTEFANVEALNSEGRERQIGRLKFNPSEQPIVTQIWGINPENFKKTAALVQELGFSGIDINMGCPEKTVLKSGSGAALINNQKLAGEIIQATKEGAPNIPVSVKSRLGVKKIQTEEWFTFLLNQKLAAITVHGRTAAEMSKVPAHWDEIAKVVKLRDEIAPQTLIIGNGDVKNYLDATEHAKKYVVDGVMIGSGIFSNLQAFDKDPKTVPLTVPERLALLTKHTKLFVDTWSDTKNFEILKKFFKIYCSNFDGAAELREKLMGTRNLEDVKHVVESFMTL